MYKPVYQLPPDLEKRCNNIITGKEIINTEEKLDEFLRFILDQGENHRDMREHIMVICMDSLGKTIMFNNDVLENSLPKRFKDVWYEIIGNDYIGPSPHPDFETDEEFSDTVWHRMRSILNGKI